MKKALCLILALVMCLSLCACSEDVPNGTTTATENNTDTSNIQTETTEDETEKQVKYDYALAQLEASKTDYTDPSALVKEAYDILIELDSFKDAKNYLQQITIIQDVCILIESFQTNAFGEKTDQYEFPRGYDLESRLSWFSYHEYIPGFETPKCDLVYIYSYENNGRVGSLTYKNAVKNETISIRTNQYDENGKITAETVQYSGGSISVYNHEYNAAGQCIKSLYDGWYEEFKYDEKGHKIEMVKCFDNGYKYVEKYYYNDSGDIIQIVGDDIYQQEESSAQQQNKLYIREYVYDTGRIVAEKYYSTYNLENPKDSFNCVEYNYVYGDYYCYTPAE